MRASFVGDTALARLKIAEKTGIKPLKMGY
jgi:hypothetical protein